MPGFVERLRDGPPLVLDAAMGSDLDRRGLPTTLPLWSALGLLERPDLVRQIHLDNLLAGADIVTTDTFRTTGRTLLKAGLDPGRAPELDCASGAAGERGATWRSGRSDAFIAGSIAPLEDCYLPVFETPPEIALAEHRAQARSLAADGRRSADGRDDADGGGGRDRTAGGGGDGAAGHSWIRLRGA